MEIKLDESQFNQLNTNVVDTITDKVRVMVSPELQPPILNRKNIAKFFGVAESTIGYWVSIGCPFIDIEGRKLYSKDSVNNWLASHEKRVKK